MLGHDAINITINIIQIIILLSALWLTLSDNWNDIVDEGEQVARAHKFKLVQKVSHSLSSAQTDFFVGEGAEELDRLCVFEKVLNDETVEKIKELTMCVHITSYINKIAFHLIAVNNFWPKCLRVCHLMADLELSETFEAIFLIDNFLLLIRRLHFKFFGTEDEGVEQG